jgi:hypothetical protein
LKVSLNLELIYMHQIKSTRTVFIKEIVYI